MRSTGRDLHRQKNRKALRCHFRNVAGWTINQSTAPFEQMGERYQGEAPGRGGSPRLDLTFPEQGELLSEK